jgi:microcystin-dependent protein
LSYPQIVTTGYSYTAFQVSQGNNSFPGTEIDADFADFAANQAAIVAFMSTVIRSDGQLNNGIVTASSLGPSITLGVGIPTVWATATAYTKGNTAVVAGKLYYCTVANTSGVFASDLAAGYWALMFDFTIPGALGAGVVQAANIAAGAVTAAALASNSVTSVAIQPGTIEAALAADGAGTVPVGAMIDFAGLVAPAKWYFPIGQAVSRTTYFALLGALTLPFTGTTASGTANVTGVSQDLRGLGLLGAKVEGLGVPLGTTILAIPTATTLTLSANASASGLTPMLGLPFGQGDGSTTFNLPDKRGRASAGRDDMGGTAAGRMTVATVLGTQLGGAGGSETINLTTPQLPSHSHTATDSGHTHAAGSFVTGSVCTGISTVNLSTGGINANQFATFATSAITGTSASGTANVTIGSTGSGTAVPVMAPVLVVNCLIFAGV